MGMFDPDDLSQGGLERVDFEIDRFERLAEEGRDVELRPYWTNRLPHSSLSAVERLVCLGGLIKADLRRRFRKGESPEVAEYLQEFPQLLEADSRVVSLVYEEFCLREEHGETVDVESFCDRYPDWKSSLVAQLQFHQHLSMAAGLTPPKPQFPKVGERFEEFDLVERIGEGGYSHVFLARDLSLGGKRVVLKVSIDRGQEPETQGALDHPHIVPVNSVAYQTEAGLRGLSMPYRPGLPLDEVIRRVRNNDSARPRRRDGRPTSAKVLWNALVEGIGPATKAMPEEVVAALRAGPSNDGWREFPVGGTFAQGAAWLGLVLARALAYAHENRTFHRDVKPGNVLLTIQHGPQLLDFNLAQSPHAPREAHSAIQGGTLPYMAPEQIEAFLDPDQWADVGAGADIYSLGLVLNELLTGRPPDVPDAKLPPPRALRELLDRRVCLTGDVRRHAPKTPHALEAIVRKCLRYDPADRYRSAKDLVEDLERFLQHRPPVHTVNPSRAERASDWAKRNRRILAVNALYLAVLALISPLIIRQARMWLLPDIKVRPDFNLAVQMVDAQIGRQPIEQLEKLAEEYPDSPLPRLYLSLAHLGAKSPLEDPAQTSYAEVMKFPGVRDELLAWAQEHPSLASHLRRLSDHALQKFNEDLSTRELKRQGGRPLQQTNEKSTIREAGYDSDDIGPSEVEIAAHASSIAFALEPDSPDAIYCLATVDESRKQYQQAYDKLTSILGPPTDEFPSYGTTARRLQRSRVTNHLAEEAGHSTDRKRLEYALTLLDEALEDQAICARSLHDELRWMYFMLRTESLLKRGELNRRLHRSDQSRNDLQDAEVAMDAWFDVIRTRGNGLPREVEDRYRGRLRELQDCSRLAGSNPPPSG